MKAEERKSARRLREQGRSVREIAIEIKCSKGSISKWVRDIPLTSKQIARLKSNQDKGRAKAAQHPNSSKQKWERIRNEIIERSAKEIPAHFSGLDLKILGAALYWAEGYNAGRNLVVFANTDPNMIKLMMNFFRKICKTPESKFRGRVNIHPHLDINKAQRYWSKISNIPIKQFHKPLVAISRSSKGKKDNLPLGTFRVVISDVFLCSRIKGWTKGLSNWANRAVGLVG